ncbi:MAG TPA: cyclopropane-fatty-acyl-phospholipid synthase family protein [Gemmataceae bacterium]
MATAQLAEGRALAASRSLLETLTEGYGPRDFAVRFWDGSTWEPDPGQPARFTLALNHPGAVRAMFWPFNNAGLGEAYIYDDFDIEGDAIAFVGLLRYVVNRKWTIGQKANILWRLSRLPKEEKPRVGRGAARLSGGYRSPERDRQAISYHYDQPGEFFQLFLDPHAQYSCAYFKTPDDDLETAQRQKLDLICRKLRLKPGERLLDIGSGWGGLVMHAAKHYGVNAFGITLSRRQFEWAERRIREEGLQDRCRVECRDYRDLSESEPFDKAVSVGVAEHFGERMMPVFFDKLWKVMRPGGVYLHHCITLKNFMPYPRWTAFARKYVFPDGEVRPLLTSLRAGEQAGF